MELMKLMGAKHITDVKMKIITLLRCVKLIEHSTCFVWNACVLLLLLL